tara:strand:- start:1323 stop:1739 length:417 start_codon:yes stop_codon:yes gene_type:complete
LFDSELLKENHLIPRAEWERIRKYETLNVLDQVNEELVGEIIRPDGYINLHKFMHILDLFTLLPISKTVIKNSSKEIYNCLSGNRQDSHTVVHGDPGGRLQKSLDLLWIKLDERFKSMADAYRYFDTNFNNRVSFGEF